MDKLHKNSKKIKKLETHLQSSGKSLIIKFNSMIQKDLIVQKIDWKNYLKSSYLSFDQYKKTGDYEKKQMSMKRDYKDYIPGCLKKKYWPVDEKQQAKLY